MVRRHDGYRRSPVWRILEALKKKRVLFFRRTAALKFIRKLRIFCAETSARDMAYWKKIKMTERSQFFAEMSQKMPKYPGKRSQYEPNSQPFPAILG